MGTLWYCCYCKWATGSGLLSELCSRCLECDRERCPNCELEPVRSQEEGEDNSLYSRPETDRVFTESEAPQETDYPLTERASLPPTKNTTVDPFNYSTITSTKRTLAGIPKPVPSIHYGRNETGPLSGVESEISRPSRAYEDIERTPRSCPDTEPSDSLSTIDKDAHSAGILFGEAYLTSGGYFTRPSDMSADPNLHSINELLLKGTGGAEANEIGPIDSNLVIAYDGADAVQPQRHYSDAPWLPIIDVNAPEFLNPPGNIYDPSLLWTNTTFPHSNVPRQLSAVESFIDQSETSSSLTGSSLRHTSADQQHSARKDKTLQTIKACESCLSTAELDGKSLACVFYKHNPEEYFKCSSKEFKTIGHLRQHLDRHHKLEGHPCKRCWVSFDDEGSLKTHAGCQPKGGIPVNYLKAIPKARDSNSNKKWYWTWKQLFGENTPLPRCPYPHGAQDLKDYALNRFCKDLEAKANGSGLTIDQIKETAALGVGGQAMTQRQFIGG